MKTIKEQVITRINEVGRLRKDKGRLTRKDVAIKSKVSEASLSRWINGHTSMQDNHVERICDTLKIEFIKINKEDK